MLYFREFCVNPKKITFMMFLDSVLGFILGTEIKTRRGICVFLRASERKGYFDLGVFKLPAALVTLPHERDLIQCLFFESVYFLCFRGKKTYLWKEGAYENPCVCLEKGDVLIDAGANVGLISASAAYRGAHVYAFEPLVKNIAYMKDMLGLNPGFSAKIKIVPLGLYDRKCSLEFNVNEDFLGNSSILEDVCGGRCYEQKKIRIDVISLDEWAEQEGIRKIDFIKADIEGAERFMLMGARRVLREMKPKLAICTYHLPDDVEVLEKIVREANSSYEIFHSATMMYAK